MLRFVYSTLFRLILPFVLIRLWWQGRTSPDAVVHWRDRIGLIPRSDKPVIWVHAVSVGETIAAAPLVRALLERRPDASILMTAMTATGRARANALFGDRIRYAYSPYDTPGSVRRFLRRARPLALVIMETELWPNMIYQTAGAGTPVYLINARLSERSARSYQRFPNASRQLLKQIDWIAAQADGDARRFVETGAHASAVSITGSVKFDVVVTDELRDGAAELRSQLGAGRPVWIAASTHDGEDEQILQAHRQLLAADPQALLVLVPRHPERFDDVAALVRQCNLSLARRSEGGDASGSQVYLADSMGELMMLYGAADVAFVGGSLIERGGHNPLEPAAWGMPVITGPHVFNFDDIYERLESGAGLVRVGDARELAAAVDRCFSDSAHRNELGKNARAAVDANRGALTRVVDGIVEKLG
ncbi:3-deoxy-D-manno-octulosonic acid transferase [Marinobacter halodurans]|uniref:3-deoxy-D-manno-octulosonic acid transferase n=1 Tax=Marinobacter halodurans TaxID=2528979 RepID=A0ABY1ZKG1_9GAMM|nr:lipid IV(A) 3-deoxy-D-manno-octulosonic acid transferase [Marinobacter halodurans]TBW55891.1 3-deoxy-D-manno-octulosonic acid transferase [Marinobacter halodurans]